uniref:Reverse transcriptase zinc-binding domain-containing protein n=2 Tax=Aegilops tauschii subsp. strangulata TaxID=200361 RepID=A0A453NPX8_AEGTS
MLPCWKAHLMNKAGHLAFVKAILAAIPIHQLLVLAPPKKTLKALEKIQRGFLWAGRAKANGGNCHVNWQRVARPIALGGLGVRDLARTGLALRTRWLWFSRTDQGRAWAGLDLQFSDDDRAFFFASTTMSVGNGAQAVSGRTDGLMGAPFARSRLTSTRASPSATVSSKPWRAASSPTDGRKISEASWGSRRLGSTYSYGTRSSRLARRGLPHLERCPLCDQAPETMNHLLLGCTFARQIWHEVLSWLRVPGPPPAQVPSLNDWWQSTRQLVPKPMRKGLASAVLLVPWMLWKHRNDCVFNHGCPLVADLLTKIKEEATLWAAAGALGLRAIIPQTWDVH